MENPLVSVLLASYNHEAYIEASVRSVMSQKGVSFELIVIDDGSRDSSPEILEKLAQELGFVYKHRENKGVMATLSELRGLAKETFFCTFSSYDMIPMRRLKAQADYLMAHPEKIACFGQIVKMDKDGNRALMPDPRYLHSIPEVSFEEFFLGKKELHGCTEMIRLEEFKANGGYDQEFPFEDFPLWLSMLEKYGSLPVLSTVCCYYREHGKNMSLDNTLMYGTFIRVLERYQSHPLYKKALNIWKSHWFSRLAYSNPKEALKRFPELASFSLPFFKRFLKLFVPSIFLKY